MHLLNRIAALLFGVLLSISLSAQQGPDPDTIPTVLFKISKPGSDKTSYLFGTHHAFGREFFDSLGQANQALAGSDLLITESLNIPGQTATDIVNARQVRTNWKHYLDRDEEALVADLFAAGSLDFSKLSPTELFTFLNRYYKEKVCLSKPGAGSQSLDDYIGSRAVELGIDRLGLETPADQITLINKDVEGMPRRIHKNRLSGIIQQIRTGNPGGCAETEWYRNMEIDYRLDEVCGNTLVLTDRNRRWMVELAGKLESNNCFIAVGLSHMMYACGLVKQIRELGYTVTPLDVY